METIEQNEEKQLKQILAEFSIAISHFKAKDYKKAEGEFAEIFKKYKKSDSYSVLEIQARCGAYQRICHAQMNPFKVELTTDEDFLMEGIFHVNAGNPDMALKHLNPLAEKNYKPAYVHYMIALALYKKGDIPGTLENLKKSVTFDPIYKVIAHNDPDFDRISENDAFHAIVTS